MGWWKCYYTLSLRLCAVLVLIVLREQMVKFIFVAFHLFEVRHGNCMKSLFNSWYIGHLLSLSIIYLKRVKMILNTRLFIASN